VDALDHGEEDLKARAIIYARDVAAAIGEEKDTIEDVYEPFLIQAGFIQRTPRGRLATALAFDHFGRTQKTAAANQPRKQPSLF